MSDVRYAVSDLRYIGMRRSTWPRWLRDTVVCAAILLFTVALIKATLALSADTPAMTIVPIVVVVLAIAAVVLLRACQGNARALMAFLFVLVFVNDALFRVREPGAIGLDWQNAMKFALWGGAALIGLSHLGRAGKLLRGPASLPLILYLFWGLISTVYSASALYSFSTCFGLISMYLLSAALADRLTERQLLLTFAFSLWIFTLAGWGAFYAAPEIGRSLFITADNSIVERMCGLAGQANSLGCDLATLLMITFLLNDRRLSGRLTAAMLAGTGFFTLLAADSRTALLAAAGGIAAVVLRRSTWRMAAAVLGLGLLYLIVSVEPRAILASLSGGISRSGDSTELFTLTGRTEIWTYAWEQIVQQPWVGYGYNSSKFILPQFNGLPGLQIDEAHNMLLQNLLGTGIIGTAPLILMFVGLLFSLARRPSAPRDLFTVANLIWGVTVAGAFGSTPTIMSLATFCGMAISCREQRYVAVRRLPMLQPLVSSKTALAR